MKKLIEKIILIIFIFFVIFKIYQFVIITKVHNKIVDFTKEENRYYSVKKISNYQNRKDIYDIKIFAKDNKVKYVRTDEYFGTKLVELKDFNTNEINIDRNGEKLDENETHIYSNKIIFDIPSIVNEKLSFTDLLKVHCIVPTKYDEKDCYKIVTKSEVIFVSKDTYLPYYAYKSEMKQIGDKTINIEYFYNFDVNNVTDDDMKM